MTTNPQGSPPRQGLSGCAIAGIVVACLGVAMFCFLGIGAALLLPAVQAAREAARRSVCQNDLMKVAIALQAYEAKYQSYPPAFVADAEGKPMHSWRVLILPFTDNPQDAELYKQYHFDEPWNGPHNAKLADEMVAVYRCPSSPGKQTDTNYLAVVGPETMWPGATPTTLKAVVDKDGLAHTILVVECADSGIHWMEPRDLTFDQAARGVNPPGGIGVSSHHPGGVNAVFCDGHVQFIDAEVAPDQLRALLTVDGGEGVDAHQLKTK